MLLEILAKNWWLLLLRGLVAVVFGIIALARPDLTLVLLITFYGIYALADGVLGLVAACMGGTMAPRWWLVLVGLIGVTAGALTLWYPGVTAIILLLFMGVSSVVRGCFEILGALQLRKEAENEWMLILSGAASMIFGLLVLVRPGLGALAVLWGIGLYAVVAGLLSISFALRLRRHRSAAA